MKSQCTQRRPLLKQIPSPSDNLADCRNRWNSFLGLWERANLIRSFLWTHEIDDERVLLTQFLRRLLRLFNVDFCFVALFSKGAKALEVGLPEATRMRLPANFSRLGLDLIADSRVPILRKRPRGPFEFGSTVISPLSPSVGQPFGFLMLAQTMPRSFASSELSLLQSLAGELSWAIRDLHLKRNHQILVEIACQELKNSLGRIAGRTDFLRDNSALVFSRPQQEQRRDFKTSVRELVNLVDGLIDVFGAHERNLSVAAESLELVITLKDIFATYRKAAEDRGIEFDVGLAADLPNKIITDPFKFRQIVHNLVASAVASTAQGKIEVVVKRSKKMLEIAAKKKGVEIPIRSGRAVGARSVSGSDFHPSGIPGRAGLYVVKEFSNLLRGHLHVRSQPGKGSEFTVCLPCE
jgi:signal transduction histidine kinase